MRISSAVSRLLWSLVLGTIGAAPAICGEDWYNLEGLDRVVVEVVLPPEVEESGLYLVDLPLFVEDKLRCAGIAQCQQRGPDDCLGVPRLAIEVERIEIDGFPEPSQPLRLAGTLFERATLSHGSGQPTWVGTWHSRVAALGPHLRGPRGILRETAAVAAEFIDDYRRANKSTAPQPSCAGDEPGGMGGTVREGRK